MPSLFLPTLTLASFTESLIATRGCLINFFFFNGTNPSNELLVKFTTSVYTRLQIGDNPHLGLKSVNTRPKARQCGEVKLAQFKDRTSDLHLFA
ncbi:hypothetical protein Hanom_Chr01g00035861 [Helianthus anomalus]